jgi:lipoprotein signal peptidase
MLALAVALMLLDQIIKLFIVAFIPFQTAVPLVKGWLNLAHSCNFQGSWLLTTLEASNMWLLPSALLATLMVLCSWFCYRYYVVNQRASIWADVAFLGLFAGLVSWLVEMGLRGHIVDFICLPDLVTADLKDIYLALGISAIFVEYLDNPGLLRAWQGWRQESSNWRQLVTNIIRFSQQELSDAWTRVTGKV